MRRLALLIVLLAAAALLLSACSRQQQMTSPLTTTDDPDKAPIYDVENLLMLQLNQAMAEMGEEDWDPILIRINPITAQMSGVSSNTDMPPITVELADGYMPRGPIQFTVWVPLLEEGEHLVLPGNCIPVMFREDMDPELMENMVLSIPYAYFNDVEVLSNEYRTFEMEYDDMGQPYAANERFHINEDYFPWINGEPFSAQIHPVRPPYEEHRTVFIDPDDEE